MNVSESPNIRIGRNHCQVNNSPDFPKPMYHSASEIIHLIKAALAESTNLAVESVRTLESGVVEEHAVVILTPEKKSLLFRMWPVFFTHDKRVEFRIFTAHEKMAQLIYSHLIPLANTNDARLVEKK